MSSQLDEANDFLLSGGVSRRLKYETASPTSHTGKVIQPPQVQPQREIDTGKPKYWEDGTPRQQIVVRLQTDEPRPGHRRR